MSVRQMAKVWELDLPQPLKLLALALADWADDEGGNVWPSIDTIARKIGASPRTVQRQLRQLEALDLVRVEHAGGGRGRTQRLRLTTQNGVRLSPLPKRASHRAQKGDTRRVKGDRAVSPDPDIHQYPSGLELENQTEPELPPRLEGEGRREYVRRILIERYTLPAQDEPHPRPGGDVQRRVPLPPVP